MIGDHQQLRPKPSNNDLAWEKKLDIPLFERLIKLGYKSIRLDEQRRMRPEVSIYARKVFYDGMFDHESVRDKPYPKCFHKNVQFINYNAERSIPIREKQLTDSTSKVNVKEAEFAVNLAWFLIRYGYAPNDITILTYYTGQVAELKRVQDKLRNKPMD